MNDSTIRQIQRISDGIWTIETMVDEEGQLCVWVWAHDGTSQMDIYESGDFRGAPESMSNTADSPRSWANRFSTEEDKDY
jgi:hypothetical protein